MIKKLFKKRKEIFLGLTLVWFCFLFFFSFLPTSSVFAEEKFYTTQFQAEYFPNIFGESDVYLKIKITHHRSDVYVKEFNLIFSKNFVLSDIQAKDEEGEIPVILEKSEEGDFKVKLSLLRPKIGKGSENNLFLFYKQKNLFKSAGNIWEIIIPVIRDHPHSEFSAIFNLPEVTQKKLSIAKPKPDYISGKKIFWNNVKTKTIYAIFGESQFYETELNYHLLNPKSYPVYIDVAFPPETLYQKVYLQSISPLPSKVFIDEDGNYLGRYFLKPKEKKIINFLGTIEVLSTPQEEMLEYIKNKIEIQKKYLLTTPSFWQLDSSSFSHPEIKNLKTIEDIYRYVVNKLTYNYQKVSIKNQRVGANQVIKNPKEAVCMEFTDLFIGLAREKGIFAREINGYAYSFDSSFRPLSLVSDLLHSWPEYFDPDKKIWIPVDPTWEKTSGIDYFYSLDLNHIAFVIHGKDPIYPLAAGMYKIEDSKDVEVKVAEYIPKITKKIGIKERFSSNLLIGKNYKQSISFINQGNVFIKNENLWWQSQGIEIEPSKIKIDYLAPYQEINYQFNLKAKDIKRFPYQGKIVLYFEEKPIWEKKIKIVSSFSYFFKNLVFFISGLFLVIFLFKFLKKKIFN